MSSEMNDTESDNAKCPMSLDEVNLLHLGRKNIGMSHTKFSTVSLPFIEYLERELLQIQMVLFYQNMRT